MRRNLPIVAADKRLRLIGALRRRINKNVSVKALRKCE
jgi:hypothetical protein